MNFCPFFRKAAIPENEFARGEKGIIYNWTSNRLLKWINVSEEPDAFDNEIIALQKLDDLRVAPKLHQAVHCSEDAFLVIEKIEGYTLENWLNPHGIPRHLRKVSESKLATLLPLLMEKLRIMKEKDVQNNDLHDKNIMVIESCGQIDLRIIDFGDASEYQNDADYHEICNTLYAGYNVLKSRIIKYTGKDFEFWKNAEGVPITQWKDASDNFIYEQEVNMSVYPNLLDIPMPTEPPSPPVSYPSINDVAPAPPEPVKYPTTLDIPPILGSGGDVHVNYPTVDDVSQPDLEADFFEFAQLCKIANIEIVDYMYADSTSKTLQRAMLSLDMDYALAKNVWERLPSDLLYLLKNTYTGDFTENWTSLPVVEPTIHDEKQYILESEPFGYRWKEVHTIDGKTRASSYIALEVKWSTGFTWSGWEVTESSSLSQMKGSGTTDIGSSGNLLIHTTSPKVKMGDLIKTVTTAIDLATKTPAVSTEPPSKEDKPQVPDVLTKNEITKVAEAAVNGADVNVSSPQAADVKDLTQQLVTSQLNGTPPPPIPPNIPAPLVTAAKEAAASVTGAHPPPPPPPPPPGVKPMPPTASAVKKSVDNAPSAARVQQYLPAATMPTATTAFPSWTTRARDVEYFAPPRRRSTRKSSTKRIRSTSKRRRSSTKKRSVKRRRSAVKRKSYRRRY